MKKTIQDYERKAKQLNEKYPAIKAVAQISPFGGRLEIVVIDVKKAKALNEMFSEFTFTTNLYK